MEIVCKRLPIDLVYEVEEYLVAGKTRFLERKLPPRVDIGNYAMKMHGRHYHTSFHQTGVYAWRCYYFEKQLYYYSIEYTISNTNYRFTLLDEYWKDVLLKQCEWDYDLEINGEEVPYNSIFENPRRSIQ